MLGVIRGNSRPAVGREEYDHDNQPDIRVVLLINSHTTLQLVAFSQLSSHFATVNTHYPKN